MTDRHAGYIVTLEDGIREDFADPVINALRQIKGVISVQPIVEDYDVAIATDRIRWEMRSKLFKVIDELFK